MINYMCEYYQHTHWARLCKEMWWTQRRENLGSWSRVGMLSGHLTERPRGCGPVAPGKPCVRRNLVKSKTVSFHYPPWSLTQSDQNYISCICPGWAYNQESACHTVSALSHCPWEHIWLIHAGSWGRKPCTSRWGRDKSTLNSRKEQERNNF